MNQQQQTTNYGLSSMPARSRIEAIETESGEWLAASSDFPSLIGAGITFEDTCVEIFDLIEVAERLSRPARDQ